jgi:hypothetical protein
MNQSPREPFKLSHLPSSTVEPFKWRRWRYEFMETPKGGLFALSSERKRHERYFKEHHSEAVKLYGNISEWYDVREAYEKGLRRHDPLWAPHGLFCGLAHGNNKHAREFLEMFGPLWLPEGASISSPEFHIRREGSREVPVIQNQIEIDLTQFWGLHRRFCLVEQLWKATGNASKLVSAWRDLECHREEASAFDVLPLGACWGGRSDPPESYYDAWWPWDHPKQKFEEWLRDTPTGVLCSEALKIVDRELNLHIRGAQIYWERGWEPTGAKFRQIVAADNLWSVMWEFFGWDTSGQSWRRCPHCQRLFYPKRRDQFYCTSRQQALASKRDYARRRRADEIRNARKRARGANQ